MEQRLNESATQRIERRKASRTPVEAAKSSAYARDDELHRTMPLRKDLNQQSGQSTLEEKGRGLNAQSTLNPTELRRTPRKPTSVAGRALTINVLDSQNVHNVINMV